VRNNARCGKFVQVASGYPCIVTGFLKGQYLFVRYQKFFQTLEPFENQKIVDGFPLLGLRNEQKRFCFPSLLVVYKCMKIVEQGKGEALNNYSQIIVIQNIGSKYIK